LPLSARSRRASDLISLRSGRTAELQKGKGAGLKTRPLRREKAAQAVGPPACGGQSPHCKDRHRL
jgi:hypothetical protein